MGQKHIIDSLSNKHLATLDSNDTGHMLFLPAPSQNSTLSIYCYDDNGIEYHVTDIQLSSGSNILYYLDPTSTPYCERVAWVLSSNNNPNIPYDFITQRHGKPMTPIRG